jgi:hypothetical protein
MADSTLNAIQLKVRRLTRSPSQSQITDAQIDEYINTFILYDFPSQLRLFSARQTFTFYTIPNVDQYATNTTYANNPLYQFQQKYITVHEPLYIGGFRAYYTQSRDEFYGMWPQINAQIQIGVGDGVTTTFSATAQTTFIEPPFIQNNVTFSATAADNSALTMVDVPVVDAVGNPTMNGNLYVPGFQPATPPTVVIPSNTVNYLTGAYTITFANDQNMETAPSGSSLLTNPSQNQIFAQTIPYLASIPTSMLYFDNMFTLRPVPQISYPVQMEVYVRPTQLISDEQSPQLEQWWQYIAYGAAIKVLQDRTDLDTVQLLMPEFKEQERMVLRTTLVQEATQRASSIYQQQTSLSASGWSGGFWTGGL